MIPFEWWPGSWGLKGKTKEIAKAEYELEGYDLDVQLAKINNRDQEDSLQRALLAVDLKYNKITEYEFYEAQLKLDHPIESTDFKHQKLELDRRYQKISDYDYDKGIAELNNDERNRTIAVLEAELKHQRITDQEFERRKADTLEEPWIAMPKIGWDPINPAKTYFELDYNDYFVNFLRDNGYNGSDEDCINRWLHDVCYSVLDDMNQPEPELISPIKRVKLPDGKTEHS